MPDYYALLQLAPDASTKKVRASYRTLVKTCHPDLHPGNAKLAQQFIALTEAYNTLTDKKLRRLYDDELAQKSAGEAYPARETLTRQPRKSRREMSRLYSHEHSWQETIDAFLLTVLCNPITYCVIVLVFLLAALKETVDSMRSALPPH